MRSDLRTWWSTASPRERDGRVAETLGLDVIRKCYRCGHGEDSHRSGGLCEICIPPSDTTGSDSACQSFVRFSPHPYSTSWVHAGPLLSQLAEEGWFPELHVRTDDCGIALLWVVTGCDSRGSDLYSGLAASPTSAIALAFCLAKEAQP
jgi:hypothetical protein